MASRGVWSSKKGHCTGCISTDFSSASDTLGLPPKANAGIPDRSDSVTLESGAPDVSTYPPSHRPAAVAGLFYSSDPRVLSQQIHHWIHTQLPEPSRPCPKVLIVPHAGYFYSGEVAALAYGLLKPFRHQIRRVVLLGPMHRLGLCGMAIPSVDVFETPMGPIRLDRKSMASLLMNSDVLVSDEAHAFEHSLEVQLPFLKHVLSDFVLVPLTIGRTDGDAVFDVVEQLWGGDETLVIVSTDLSHFMSSARAARRDRETLAQIMRFSPTLGPDDACGALGVNAVLRAASGRHLHAELLAATHSGNTTGDMTRVVGYGAVALW